MVSEGCILTKQIALPRFPWPRCAVLPGSELRLYSVRAVWGGTASGRDSTARPFVHLALAALAPQTAQAAPRRVSKTSGHVSRLAGTKAHTLLFGRDGPPCALGRGQPCLARSDSHPNISCEWRRGRKGRPEAPRLIRGRAAPLAHLLRPWAWLQPTWRGRTVSGGEWALCSGVAVSLRPFASALEL